MTTETLDKAYLEYSNVTEVETAKELALIKETQSLKEQLKRETVCIDKCYEIMHNARFPMNGELVKLVDQISESVRKRGVEKIINDAKKARETKAKRKGNERRQR